MKIHIAEYGHVPDRMQERRISRADIELVLENFPSSWPSARGKSRVYSGTTSDGRVIHVVVKDPPDPDGTLQVKTVYEPSKEG